MSRLTKAQKYARTCGYNDAKKGKVDGWANHSPSYREGQEIYSKEVAGVEEENTDDE